MIDLLYFHPIPLTHHFHLLHPDFHYMHLTQMILLEVEREILQNVFILMRIMNYMIGFYHWPIVFYSFLLLMLQQILYVLVDYYQMYRIIQMIQNCPMFHHLYHPDQLEQIPNLDLHLNEKYTANS